VRNTVVHQSAKRRVKSLKSLVGSSLLYFAFCTLLMLLQKLTQDLPMLYLYGMVWRRNTRTRSHKPIERKREREREADTAISFSPLWAIREGFLSSDSSLSAYQQAAYAYTLAPRHLPLGWLTFFQIWTSQVGHVEVAEAAAAYIGKGKRKKISRENVAAFS